MDKEDVRKIIKQRAKKIAKLSSAIGKDFETEHIHKFRVEVKRLRSLLRLLASVKDDRVIKLPKQFKCLYNICGLIREAQLEQKKIAELKLQLPAYGNELQQRLRRQKRAWRKQYSKKTLDMLHDKLGMHKFNDMPPAVLPRFFNEHCKSIESLCKKKPTNEDIHSIRKEVKDMLYNAKFVEEEWKDAYKKIEKKPLKEMDRLSDALGAYNDLRIMLEHFEDFSSADLSEGEQRILTDLCKRKRRALESRKEHLMLSIAKFIKDMQAS